MDRYDLRSCFLPDLSGLHVRIYQFRELLRANLPLLWSHLEDLQVETAYVSQWFLSFFATTCPLPMLFRIYDVVFAEGASETLMRVALSLMRRNEARLLSCTELEDVMQLLLSRGLWDCYHYNADEFVQDFASLTGTVTREKLAQLEQGYRESLVATANTARTSDIATAAARFLGRIWASSGAFPRNSGLAPGLSAPSRPLSMLRRSTSKQSLASTLNSVEASSVSVTSSSSTDATTVSRDSSNTTEDDSASRESTPVAPKVATAAASSSSKNTEDKYLHSQIEDLLTALSELQRNHALLSNELKREREEREEDRKAVRSLLDGLRKRVSRADEAAAASGEAAGNGDEQEEEEEEKETEEKEEEETEEKEQEVADAGSTDAPDAPSTEDLSELLDRVESRFGNEADDGSNNHNKSKPPPSDSGPKSELQKELDQAKDQLASAMSQNQDFNRRIHDLDQEMSSLKEQLRESHGHVRTLHQDKQRLEKQIQVLRARPISSDPMANRDSGVEWAPKSNAGGGGGGGGLREFKLGRSKSVAAQGATYNRRKSSLLQQHDLVPPPPASMPATPSVSNDSLASTNDLDTLLLELAQAKTAQAIAKQEAEEAKQKLEAMRKAFGVVPGDSPNTSPGSTNPKAVQAAATTSPGTGGFWGWRR